MKTFIFILLAFLSCTCSAQIITTIAGTGTGGFNSNGIPATASELDFPYGVGIDSSGNIYIGDAYNNMIRMINTSGIISTIAGTGSGGYNGDLIAATAAKLNFPYGMAVNRAGTIVIADMSNNRVRMISSEARGLIYTIGGTGAAGFSGDGGPATAATMDAPQGIFWDIFGNVYFGDHNNHRVRKISAMGTITTIAGNGTGAYAGDGGAATAAELYYPSGVTADNVGNIYIADMYNHAIRRIDHTTGIITTVAGTGIAGFSGDGGPATAANIRYPKGVCLDNLGNILFTDTDNLRLRKVDAVTGIITTIAGTGTAGYSGDGMAATASEVNFPQGIFVNNHGDIIFGDCPNNRVREIVCVPPAPDTISGFDTVCTGSSVTLTSRGVTGAWACSNGTATISGGGVVSGINPGWDTISYTVANSCALAVATFPVYVKNCTTRTTGISNAALPGDLHIYPDPATSSLTISYFSGEIQHIEVFDLLGNQVYSQRFHDPQVTVDIAAIPAGVYVVRINDSWRQKIIKL